MHRNLDPDHVLFADAETPKITGFGRFRRPDPTRPGGIVGGTPPYMAPELGLARFHEIGPPTDVWTLGVTLYQCLTGALPFRGTSVVEVFEQVCRVVPRPPCTLRPEVPPGLEAVCLKCLEKEPEKRYASAFELAGALRLFLAGGAPPGPDAGSTPGPPPAPARPRRGQGDPTE